jgi:hypothetical protein
LGRIERGYLHFLKDRRRWVFRLIGQIGLDKFACGFRQSTRYTERLSGQGEAYGAKIAAGNAKKRRALVRRDGEAVGEAFSQIAGRAKPVGFDFAQRDHGTANTLGQFNLGQVKRAALAA